MLHRFLVAAGAGSSAAAVTYAYCLAGEQGHLKTVKWKTPLGNFNVTPGWCTPVKTSSALMGATVSAIFLITKKPLLLFSGTAMAALTFAEIGIINSIRENKKERELFKAEMEKLRNTNK